MSRQERWVLALTAAAALMVALDTLVVSTALGTIRAALHASPAALGWTVDAYAVSFAVLLMPAATLGDRIGRRRVFGAGLALFTLASAACALAPTVGALIAARAVQGVGAATVMPLGLALLGQTFDPTRRARALGTYSAVIGISTVAGPVLGGVLTQALSWSWIFWLNVPIGLALGGLTLLRVPESRGPDRPIDLPGLVLLTVAVVGVVWGLVRSTSTGWARPEVVGALVAGVVFTAGFVTLERRRPHPLVPPRLFAVRAFAAGNAAMFFLNATLFGALFVLAQYEQAAFGLDSLHTGLRLLPWGLAIFAGAKSSPALLARFGARAVAGGGLAAQAVGLAGLAAVAAAGSGYVPSTVPMLLAGLGFGAGVTAIQQAVLGAVAGPDLGTASGTVSTIRQLGGAFGLALTVIAFTAAGGYASPATVTDGFVAAIACCAGLSLLGALISAGLDRRPAPTGDDHAEEPVLAGSTA